MPWKGTDHQAGPCWHISGKGRTGEGVVAENSWSPSAGRQQRKQGQPLQSLNKERQDASEAVSRDPGGHCPGTISYPSSAPGCSVSIPWLSLTLWPERVFSKKQYSTSQLGPVSFWKVNCNLEVGGQRTSLFGHYTSLNISPVLSVTKK